MTIHVLYHANCPDGFGAAWAAHRALGDDAVYIPVKHHEGPPDIPAGSQVYIIDFSYDRDTILGMVEDGLDLQILDHHITAQKELEGLEFAEFDMERSGAMMAWDHFFPGEEPPTLLKWIQDRDLWRWAIPESRQATSAMRCFPFDFDVWDRLMDDPSELLAAGKVATELTTRTVEMICKQAKMGYIGEHRVPIVNATCHWSEIGHYLCKAYPKASFAASWFMTSTLQKKWSLRSIGDFDVAAVATKYGGGGHKNAAGFTTPA